MASTRTAKPGTWNSGDLLSAADLNSLPGGSIGRDILSGDSTGTTTIETVCTVSPTVNTGRELLIMATVNLRSSVAHAAFASIFEDSVQLQRKNVYVPATATDTPVSTFIVSENPGAGAHTYELATGCSGAATATVTCSNNGGGASRGATMLEVFDSGPNY